MNKKLAEIIKIYATKSDKDLERYLPFKCNSFVSKLKKHLDRRFPDGYIPGQFLRSANFDYIGCKDLKVVYHLPEADLVKYKDNIVKGFYKFLMEVASND